MRETVLRVEQVEIVANLFKHLRYLAAINKIAGIALRPTPPLIFVIVIPCPSLSSKTATQVHSKWLRRVLDKEGLLLVGSELPEDLAFGQTASTQEESLRDVVVLVPLLLDGCVFLLRVIYLGLGIVKVRVGRRSQEGLERRDRGSLSVI